MSEEHREDVAQVPSSSNTKKSRFSFGRIVQIILALAGFLFFFFLAREVDFASIPSASVDSLPTFIITILALFIVNYTFDTASWWLLCGDKRPRLFQLMTVRARCEAITNVVPGGALIGEPMKIGFLMGYTSMSRAEATTSFLLSKLVLVIGQTFYILIGLTLSYSVISNVSKEIFGVEDFAALVLGGALLIFGLVISLAVAMVWFQPMNTRFSFSEKEGRMARWWNIALKELREIEVVLEREMRMNKGRFLIAILFSFIAWSMNGVELYVIVKWIGVHASFLQVYAIDAVSVVVRMVLFVVPIGLGGQDWTITKLVEAHGFSSNPLATAKQMFVLKRAREFFVIGVGLLLLLFMPKPQRSNA